MVANAASLDVNPSQHLVDLFDAARLINADVQIWARRVPDAEPALRRWAEAHGLAVRLKTELGHDGAPFTFVQVHPHGSAGASFTVYRKES